MSGLCPADSKWPPRKGTSQLAVKLAAMPILRSHALSDDWLSRQTCLRAIRASREFAGPAAKLASDIARSLRAQYLLDHPDVAHGHDLVGTQFELEFIFD